MCTSSTVLIQVQSCRKTHDSSNTFHFIQNRETQPEKMNFCWQWWDGRTIQCDVFTEVYLPTYIRSETAVGPLGSGDQRFFLCILIFSCERKISMIINTFAQKVSRNLRNYFLNILHIFQTIIHEVDFEGWRRKAAFSCAFRRVWPRRWKGRRGGDMNFFVDFLGGYLLGGVTFLGGSHSRHYVGMC